jgi:hypothetical protein
MMPKYKDGDVLIFDPDVPVASGDDCFIHFINGSTTFRRVNFGKRDELVNLCPLNRRYKPEIVRRDTIAGMYKALFKYVNLEIDRLVNKNSGTSQQLFIAKSGINSDAKTKVASAAA